MITTLLAIKKWWHARQRKIDLQCLWMVCLDMTEGDVEAAKDAFAMHCLNDPAWQDLGINGIVEFIENLDSCASSRSASSRKDLREAKDLPVASRRTIYSEHN